MHINKYITHIEDGGNILVFNALNGAILCLDGEGEATAFRRMVEEGDDSALSEPLRSGLIHHGFLLDDGINETDVAKRNYLEMYRRTSILRLLIYVTEDCNCRCVYCPQLHKPRYMELETIRHLADFVSIMLDGMGGYDNVYVSWFGGEPLLNMPVIKLGMELLRDVCEKHEVPLHAGMTTNAWLLDEKVFRQLITLGVTEYQITMDGMPKTHDIQRPLKGGSGSWKRIWENLIHMNESDFSFSVSLRINANQNTLSSARELIKLASCSLDKRFSIQAQPISNMGNPTPEAEALYCDMREANDVRNDLELFANSLKRDFAIPGAMLQPFGMMCTSFLRGYYVISVDGTISKCELRVDDEVSKLGSLYDEKKRINTARLSQFTTLDTSSECENCRMYPMCYGLSCPYRKVVGEHCGFDSMAYAVESQMRALSHSYYT